MAAVIRRWSVAQVWLFLFCRSSLYLCFFYLQFRKYENEYLCDVFLFWIFNVCLLIWKFVKCTIIFSDPFLRFQNTLFRVCRHFLYLLYSDFCDFDLLFLVFQRISSCWLNMLIFILSMYNMNILNLISNNLKQFLPYLKLFIVTSKSKDIDGQLHCDKYIHKKYYQWNKLPY